MASINELKERIDLHDLAAKLGIERPGGKGNYRCPIKKNGGLESNPSLSIFPSGKRFKCHRCDVTGSCVDMVIHAEGGEVPAAIKRLHEIYSIPFDRPKQSQEPRREKTRVEYIADKCIVQAERAIEYLVGERKIPEPIVRRAIEARSIGFNDWVSDKVPAGEPMHGGPGVAFIVRSLNPGHVVAVDVRYIDPKLNGGVKTQTQGEKQGSPWTSDPRRLERARKVLIFESAINALSAEACEMPGTAALATRGTGSARNIDWRFLIGKEVVICMDNDEPDDDGKRPGPEAAWAIHEQLTALNIAAHLVDQGEWQHNDVNDLLRDGDMDKLKSALRHIESFAIPGLRGDDKNKGKPRLYLPPHDFGQYWRYRVKEDFTRFIAKRKEEDGQVIDDYQDLAGFRLAGLSRVTIASAVSTMTGDRDNQPLTLFSVSVQTPRHGAKLVRKVFQDEELHNVERWKKFGPVFNQAAFSRLVTMWERAADIGSRHASNFVGLAWRDGRLIVNEGPDCYFTEPEKQCPYHNLTFPSGSSDDGRRVIGEYQKTFKKNAAAFTLVWALGGHLKAFLGFWPHLIMQADKGAGKSTLIKRVERTLSMTMFSRQTISTEFRIVTSVSHTSHPVGWEEISAGRQDVIDKAVSTLQECYQYTVTRRGSDMTEFLLCAPVLLAGEDVPVRSLLGKVVHTDLTGKKGPMMPEDLPQFPVLQWLKFLAGHTRPQVRAIYEAARQHCVARLSASKSDAGAQRMVENYAAVLTSWRLVCEFTETDPGQGGFEDCLLEEMNRQVLETAADREPWVWIMETILSEIAADRYQHPYAWDDVKAESYEDAELCLLVRTSHIMDHIAHTSSLRDKWNSLPVKSDRVFKRQIKNAGVVVSDTVEKTIGGKRVSHMTAISAKGMEKYGLYAAPDEAKQAPGNTGDDA